MKHFYILGLLLGITLSHSDFASAHGGRLDANGCHGGSRPYHCHRSPSEMVPSSSGGSRLRCSAGSNSQDCSGSGISNQQLEAIMATPKNTRYYREGKDYYVDAKTNPTYRINLFLSNNSKVFAIETIDSSCTKFEPKTSITNKHLILDGKKIDLQKQCLGFYKSNLYPVYVNDKELLITTFKKAHSVTLSLDYTTIKFSALGFTHAFNSL